jgi:hypothetical protein
MKLAPILTALALLGSNAALAAPLVTFSDTSPDSSAQGFLSDNFVNWAVSWTQAAPSSNVTLSAILSSNVGQTSANWYVTTRIGAGTTLDDVVHAGEYVLSGSLDSSETFDFNLAPRTVLGSGLSFAAGTYFLVLDGPDGLLANNANWVGGGAAGVDINLAPGFSLGDYYSTLAPAEFAPAGEFAVDNTFSARFVFELEAARNEIPIPSSLWLLGAGALAAGMTPRRKRSPDAQKSDA